MSETYMGIALAVAIVFGVVYYIRKKKEAKGTPVNTGGGGTGGEPTAPRQEKKVYRKE